MNMPGENRRYGKGYKAFMASAKTAILILVVVLFVIVVVFLSRRAYSLGYEVSSYKPVQEQEAQEAAILIKSGMTIRDVGKLLIENGIISESLEAFLIQERLSSWHDSFVPGVYVLNSSMSIEDILQAISPSEETEEES